MLDRITFWKKDEKSVMDIKDDLIPAHVAIIMDGNGRWAKRRGLPRVAGHHEGMKVVKKVVKHASDLGVKVLTLYAFSTENWKRPRDEVDFLMKLPGEFLNSFLPELIEQNVRVTIMGHKEVLPIHTIQAVDEAIEKTKNNTGLVLNFALNYGSRNEITTALTQIIQDIGKGAVKQEDVSEELISQYLMSASLPDPDLLIRTSGEVRLSNFMLWQLAYSEFWFTDINWPDFTEEHLKKAIYDYQNRGRRYGGV
ncbi:isoprenyl transferase [Fictibacillus sp. KIGAM418]|uniref:Isoprenyl transferase n=1 Tax=Fictibacillus marinisediminis TaxID=2878389 RepID=A0A9X1XA35_9BACL|nr:isoprenyl transferase [Fictibacillus marinisediminis]MCK6257042.1 isoprenyl transferase [Fictibacillus marinisediminis]